MSKHRKMVSALLDWYYENRRDLPWRKDKDPYHVWISEIMLQQTRVEAVREYYKRFLEYLPDISSLSVVDEDELLKLWQGLGYYNRARNLKKAAIVLAEVYDCSFPEEYEELLKLPGIGAYTAGAIASISFGKNVPAVDGNVYRIYTRIHEDRADIGRAAHQKKIREEIAKIVPEECPGDFNQALMDLGAMVCLPNGEPLCEKCPVFSVCAAGKAGNPKEYPYKAPKKKRKIEEKTIFVLEYQGQYFLQKRPETGLLAGLWEFPGTEGKLSPAEALKKLKGLGIEAGELELLGAGKHLFSHIEWRMIGYLVQLEEVAPQIQEEFVLVSVEELKTRYSVPSAYACYLDQIPGMQ